VAHDYIREVAYSASREARRRVFHRRALLGLETAGAPAAECAFHALAALLDEPAFRYSVAAGGEALAAYAVQDALAHLETAREVARRMQASREVARRMQARGEAVDGEALGRLYQQRGQALELIHDEPAAQASYVEIQALAVQRQDRAMQLTGLIAQGNLHSRYTGVFNPPKAKEVGQAALALAQSLGDRAAEVDALWVLQLAELYSAGDIK
jgi:hypothetical protein